MVIWDIQEGLLSLIKESWWRDSRYEEGAGYYVVRTSQVLMDLVLSLESISTRVYAFILYFCTYVPILDVPMTTSTTFSIPKLCR